MKYLNQITTDKITNKKDFSIDIKDNKIQTINAKMALQLKRSLKFKIIEIHYTFPRFSKINLLNNFLTSDIIDKEPNEKYGDLRPPINYIFFCL